MEGVQEFLESSTIHGLTYISTSRNSLIKLIWIFIVISGFFTAGMLINNAFLDWDKTPIETAITTFPISEVQFPKIIVCTPKVGFSLILQEQIFAISRHEHII
jgi:hypothetical protein